MDCKPRANNRLFRCETGVSRGGYWRGISFTFEWDADRQRKNFSAGYPPRLKACDDKSMNSTSAIRKLEETETTRRQIRSLLEEGPHTAREISSTVHRPEKEVESHLEHLRKSLHSEGRQLDRIPAECRGCGFLFRKRNRLKAPSRCPVCKGEAISDPSFLVAGSQD
jgi:predicted Zn-ribbon and HTH transcriptional regulator